MQALLQVTQGAQRLVKVDGLHRCFLLEGRSPEGAALALKDLVPGVARDPGVSSKWIQRAVQNTALRHPACSRVLEWGEQEGSGPYFVSEYHRGTPLSGVLQAARAAGQPLEPDAGAHVACVLLETLVHAAELDSSLTHLDLDPDSVIVRADGSLLVPEFGLWGVLASGELSRLRFDSGRVRCSSPELVKSQPADARSDVFSVGAILFELVTGERAFTGATQLVIAMAIAEGVRRPIQELAPRAPEALCQVLETMLATSPDARFQSGAAALTALQSAIAVDADAARARLAALAAAGGSNALPALAEVRARAPDLRGPTHDLPVASAPELRAPAAASPPVPPTLGERQHFAGLDLGGFDVREPLPPPLAPGFHARGAGASRQLSAPLPPALLDVPAEIVPSDAPPASAFAVNDGRTSHLQASLLSLPSLIVAPPKLELPAQLAAPRTPDFPPLPSSIELAARPRRERGGRARPVAASAAIVVTAERARAHASAVPEKWRDPSPTLFHARARPKRTVLRGKVRMPGAPALLLAMLFGFIAVVAAYLLYRLA